MLLVYHVKGYVWLVTQGRRRSLWSCVCLHWDIHIMSIWDNVPIFHIVYLYYCANLLFILADMCRMLLYIIFISYKLTLALFVCMCLAVMITMMCSREKMIKMCWFLVRFYVGIMDINVGHNKSSEDFVSVSIQ